MKISAGTLEGFIYGFEFDPSQKKLKDRTSLKYGYSVHNGCVKSVAVALTGSRAGNVLVTGGTDEKIKIYDLELMGEKGILEQHGGSVTCLEFVASSHLLSGSDDNTICIWRVFDWELMHILGGHKAPVNSISVHPSGRMALSVSTDRTLRLWNLIEGRQAYVKRLPGAGLIVRWSPAGEYFVAATQSTATIYATADPEKPVRIEFELKVNCLTWVSDAAVAVCCGTNIIKAFGVGGKALAEEKFESIKSRIRDISYVKESSGTELLSAITSNGSVHVFSIKAMKMSNSCMEHELKFKEIGSIEVTGQPRFTCVTAWRSDLKPTKRKAKELQEAATAVSSKRANTSRPSSVANGKVKGQKSVSSPAESTKKPKKVRFASNMKLGRAAVSVKSAK